MKPPRDRTSAWQPAAPAEQAAAERLLAAAKTYNPPLRLTLADVEAVARSERQQGARRSMRRLVAGFAAACLLLVMGGVALSRGWLGRRGPATAPAVDGPAARTVRIERRDHPRRPSYDLGTLELQGGQEAGDPEPIAAGDSVRPAAPAPVAPPPAIAQPPVAHRPPVLIAASDPKAGRSRPVVPAVAPVVPAVAPVVPPPLPPPSPLPPPATVEVTLVRDALARLRTGRDPAGALALLDDHDRRFSAGTLREEATATRIEALLSLGRAGEALQRLDAVPAATLDRWPRLRIARGELRASGGRCTDALGDFAVLLAHPAGDEIDRRAARGRAACLRLRGKGDPAL